jgi:hypothetical protein
VFEGSRVNGGTTGEFAPGHDSYTVATLPVESYPVIDSYGHTI